ncbi:MAG: UvrD-helicase domain-containing protein [Streptosporangiaceae bacterium]
MFHADLHIHSRFSRACSRDCDIEHLAWWARRKGITVVGTGDFTHPGWAQELRSTLESAEPGLFRLRPDAARRLRATSPGNCDGDVRFLLSTEISTIYRADGQTRKVHHLLYAPDFEAAHRITEALAKIGNLASDGRPILGLDSRHLLEITLGAGDGCYLIPAHAWTPWFAVLGSKSGFDTVADCYRDLAGQIFAIETGLSSDPAMNWMCSSLDRYRLVSNSDAHSPPMLGREATTFSTDLDYFAMARALRTGDGLAGTLEFYPEEGKYHLDGHRKCSIRFAPEQSAAHSGTCPECGKPLTIGVLHRVAELADRPSGYRPPGAPGFTNLVQLPQVVAELAGTGPRSKKVTAQVSRLVAALGPELDILTRRPVADISRAGGELLGEAITRLRRGEVRREAGFDGEYGSVCLFAPGELDRAAALFDLGVPDRAPDLAVPPPRVPGDPPAGEPTAAGRPPGSQTAAAAGQATSASEPARDQAGQATSASEPARDQAGQATSASEPARDEAGDPGPDGDPVGTPGAGTRGPAGAAAAGRSLLDGLDAGQRAAAGEGSPLMIIAGPGTGKTRTLAHRIAWLVTERGVAARRCLALTFTRRAAGELRDRLAALLPGATAGVTVTTFHGLGLMILREYSCEAGLPAGFGIADEPAQLAVAAELAGSARAGRELLAAAAVDADSSQLLAAALAARGLVDFDGLVGLSAALLEREPAVARALRDRWQHISVDEYQDIDAAQYQLLKLLAGDGRELTVIGDPDQAIYRFRGGDVRFFLRFGRDYPGASTQRLSCSYRSSEQIVTAALQAVRPGTLVPGRTLRSAAGPGPALSFHQAADEHAEAAWIARAVDRLLGGLSFHSLDSGRAGPDGHDGLSLADIAVLYRTDAQAAPLGQALARAGLPFQKSTHDLLSRRTCVPEILHEMRLADTAAGPAAAPGSAVAVRLQAAVQRLAERSRYPGQGEAALAAADVRTAGQVLAPLARRCGDDLDRFCTEISIGAEADALDPRADAVTLLTLHAAKGLEYEVVFLAGCERGLLPLRIPGSPPLTGDQRDEERRLLFVGMTRARTRLLLTCAARRARYGVTREAGPSPFLESIETSLLDASAPARRRPTERQLRLI